MLCAHCATPVPDEASFCYSCGSVVSDAEGEALASGGMTASSFSEIEALLRKETAGVYEIERMLGRGGMAVVYLAREVHLARHVAIKVLPPALTFGHGVERFKREAKTAAALDHPNIIPIYRVSTSGSLFWYAMKFLEGESLEHLLRTRGRLTLPETLGILGQVAEALDYAHAHQVVHRDMKPANVMLDHRQRVIVTDFGIAKALSEGKLTTTGSVIGTPNFMAPEQGMGMMVTGTSDQYSVAVMAYRMLAGHVPFAGDSALDILHRHCTTPAPPLEAAVPGLPRNVHLAVHRGLDKNPERRFPTVSAMVEAMRDSSATAASVISLPGADESAATLLVGGVDKEVGSTTSPLRIGKGLPGRPRLRLDDRDVASTGERWRRASGERAPIQDEHGTPPPDARPVVGAEETPRVQADEQPLVAAGERGGRSSGERPVIPDEPPAVSLGERRRVSSGERSVVPDEGPARPSAQHPRRSSAERPAVPDEGPEMSSAERRRRLSDEPPVVPDEGPAVSSGERRGRVSWERRMVPDRRQPPEADDPSVMSSGDRRRRSSGERILAHEERPRATPVAWPPRPDEPRVNSSGERRGRPSGERRGIRAERSRRASDAWSPYPADDWTPEEEWATHDPDERPMSTSVALRRWSASEGAPPWDERRPRWRVGSRHRLRQRPKKRRLSASLLVGLAMVFGGGMGAAGLLTWEAVVAPVGTLVIDNLPRDGSVLVDSKPADRQVIRLSPGTHQLEILAPGMESHRELVRITANTTVRVRAPQKPLEPPQVE
jgi:serine/threonine protein kinase